MTGEPAHTNRLINEKSPYLLQHAHNPVDWYPWGESAFQLAKKTNRPIFLSIGYATCHWCHVMERESFEDPEVAQLLNHAFVCIKVDREELPEIDSLYMEFAQSMLSGSGGWPLNVILTPELKPFFAATYLPKTTSKGHIGLIEVVQRIDQLWQGEERERVIEQSNKIVDILQHQVHTKGEELPTSDCINDTAQLLFRIADPVYGGMKGAPKFPLGYQANFLLRYYLHTKDTRGIFLVEKTLDMMYRGGIFDHIGGGFSRYSTDEAWLIPHFEKMLYDNALLAYAYLETWRITQRSSYKTVCESILDYILREMTDELGGFYSAEDADSEGQEGLFYTWTIDEIQHALKEHAEIFCEFYGATLEGNFEGKNVLYIPQSIEQFVEHRNISAEELENILHNCREILFELRSKRVHPLKDDKIITSWNGLAIHALAEAGFSLGRDDYLQAAQKAAHFIKDKLYADGRLIRRYREGEARFDANLDDYTFLIRGLISLFEAGCGTKWLDWAIQLATRLEMDYKDKDGAFFQTDGKDPFLIIRKSQFTDGAEPSGNSIHAENLLRLYQITHEKKYLEHAEDIFKAAAPMLAHYSIGYCYLLVALQQYFDADKKTVVIALDEQESFKQPIAASLAHRKNAHSVIVWKKALDPQLVQIAPALMEQTPLHEHTTVYICREGACEKPLTELKDIQIALESI